MQCLFKSFVLVFVLIERDCHCFKLRQYHIVHWVGILLDQTFVSFNLDHKVFQLRISLLIVRVFLCTGALKLLRHHLPIKHHAKLLCKTTDQSNCAFDVHRVHLDFEVVLDRVNVLLVLLFALLIWLITGIYAYCKSELLKYFYKECKGLVLLILVANVPSRVYALLRIRFS